MNIINIGILAHVDAGKTTLTESLLYASGTISEPGSVEKGTTRIPILIMFMSILHTRPKRAQKSPAANTFTAGDHDFGYIETHSANMSRYPSRYLIKRQKHS